MKTVEQSERKNLHTISHKFSTCCFLLLLLVSLVGNVTPSIPLVKANPPLFFTKSGNYYSIGNDNWNLTYVDDATYKWIWESVQVKNGSSWDVVYGSFQSSTSKQMLAIMKSDIGYGINLTTATVVTNTSSLKELKLTGITAIGTGLYTLDFSTSVNTTYVKYKFQLALNTTVDFSDQRDSIILTHFAAWGVKNHTQLVWTPYGIMFANPTKTKFYAEVSNQINFITPYPKMYQDILQYYFTSTTASMYGTRTSYSAELYLLYQDGGSASQMATSMNSLLDIILPMDTAYEKYGAHWSIKDDLEKELMQPYRWSDVTGDATEGSWFVSDKLLLGIWFGGAQIGYAMANLYELTGDSSYLAKATKLAKLLVHTNRGYNATYPYFYENTFLNGTPTQSGANQDGDSLYPASLAWDVVFLSKMYQLTNNATYKQRVISVLDFWSTKRNSDGTWYHLYDRNTLTTPSSHFDFPSSTFYRKHMAGQFFAYAYLKGYEISGNTTYLAIAKTAIEWLYSNRMRYGDGSAGYNVLTNYGWEEEPNGFISMMMMLTELYKKTNNATYLQWAENIYPFFRLFVARKNDGGQAQEQFFVVGNQYANYHYEAAGIGANIVKALLDLFEYTGDFTYANMAISMDRASRQFRPPWNHYYHAIKNIFELVYDTGVSADMVLSKIYIKEELGDVYLGSQQLALDGSTSVSGNANGLYAYSAVLDANVTSALFVDGKLELTINALSGTISRAKIFVGDLGRPTSVLGAASWNYDENTKMVELPSAGESLVTFTLTWPSTNVFVVELQGSTFRIVTFSNSSVDAFNFNYSRREINFNVSGLLGTTGFCNVTIPKGLLHGPFTILVDSVPISTFIQTSNSTHNSLFFTYVHSTHVIRIISDNVPPYIGDPSVYPEIVLPNRETTISVNVTDDKSGVREVILSYSVDNGVTWANVTMNSKVGDTYEGNIIGFQAATKVHYKIVAYDYENNMAVNDNGGKYYSYTVADITSPVANAGADQTVAEDTQVVFDGSGSWDDVGISSYSWTFIDESEKQLAGMTTTYVFATPGVYTVTLNATDAAGNYDTDAVSITVLDVTIPVANAGSDQTVKEGATVTFNGSNSFDNVAVSSFSWTFMDEVPKTLSGPNSSYIFNIPGAYIITLNVSDVAGNWATDTVLITVLDITKPIAEAGLNRTVEAGASVVFDAIGSSDNVGIVSYDWDFGDESFGIGVSSVHVYTRPGVYIVTLTVADEAGNSSQDSCAVTVLGSSEGLPMWFVGVVSLVAVGVAVGAVRVFWCSKKV